MPQLSGPSASSSDEASFRTKFRRLKKVGQGAYGCVYLVQHLGDNKKHILKEIPLTRLQGKQGTDPAQAALNEVTVLSRLSHPNITRFYGAWRTPEALHILMEYADGGTLADAIRTRADASRDRATPSLFEEEMVLEWFVQVATALRFMHAQSIMHRDLKAANVFLTSRNIVKVGDFGISKVLDGTAELAHTAVGTPYYLSPEVVSGDPYGLKADVWALGVLLYECMALRKPFEATSLPQLVMRITSGKYEPPPGPADAFSAPLLELLGRLLHRTVDGRPSLDELMRAPVVAASQARLQAQLRSLALLSMPPNDASIAAVAAAPSPSPAPAPTATVATAAAASGSATSAHTAATAVPATSDTPLLSLAVASGACALASPQHRSGSQVARAGACAMRLQLAAEASAVAGGSAAAAGGPAAASGGAATGGAGGAGAAGAGSGAGSGTAAPESVSFEANWRFSQNLLAVEQNLQALEGSGEGLPLPAGGSAVAPRTASWVSRRKGQRSALASPLSPLGARNWIMD